MFCINFYLAGMTAPNIPEFLTIVSLSEQIVNMLPWLIQKNAAATPRIADRRYKSHVIGFKKEAMYSLNICKN